MNVLEVENQTGLRFSWNVWPATKADAAKIELPLGALFTVLKDTNTPKLEYEPLRCRQSGGVLNPFCQVDYRNKTWVCPFSGARTPFPPKYAEHIAERPPPEMLYATVDYLLPPKMTGYVAPPSFLIVIDLCLFEEELETLKESLQQMLNLLPQDALVGLITFGAMCHVHELGFKHCPKTCVFRGSKAITAEEVQLQLGLVSRDPRGAAGGAAARRFFLPIQECEYTLSSLLDDIQKDQWPVATDHRSERCTGVALTVALALLGSCASQQSGRIMLFTGGVCTVGPGMIVSTSLNEVIRHHLDLQKETANAQYVKKALRFYTDLANQAVANGHAFDIFACSLDQVGLYEMRVLTDRSGGCLVMSDSFSMNVFKDSLKKLFDIDSSGYLQQAYAAKVEVICSKDIKVSGAIGNCTSTGKKGPQVCDEVIGEGGTCEWAIPALDSKSTLAFYFEVATTNISNVPASRHAYIQFQVTYNHPASRKALRIVTASYRYADQDLVDIGNSFDQEAAAVLVSRFAVFKTEQEYPVDVLKWLDRKLIRLTNRFADYQKDDPSSFQLSQQFCLYPGFMYHLRRSNLLQTFNVSPDESGFYRSTLLKENVQNSLLMIQPALFSYQLDAPMTSVQLDVAALKPDVVLLLDSFFHIVVWYGETVHLWREQGFDRNPEYSHVAELVEAPIRDAKELLRGRFPAPKFVCCNAGGSQARFLLAKVNPSATHKSISEFQSTYGAETASNFVITDDVPLKTFMEHLIKLCTQS